MGKGSMGWEAECFKKERGTLREAMRCRGKETGLVWVVPVGTQSE